MKNSNKNQIQKSIDLINCEGSILKVKCIDNNKLIFQIYDEWKEGVMILSKHELIQFLQGSLSIKDSKGRVWNLFEISESMVNPMECIEEEFKKQGIDLFDVENTKLNILYLNGFQSPLIEPKRDVLNRYGRVFAPFIAHRNEDDIYSKIVDLVQSEKIDIIVGSSMGGALGFLLSSNLNKPALLFNPALPYNDGAFNPIQYITSYQKCIIGNLDSVISPVKTLNYLRKYLLPTLEIKVINDLEHRIPLEVFKKQVQIFMHELKSRK
jgi:hypothetical protein